MTAHTQTNPGPFPEPGTERTKDRPGLSTGSGMMMSALRERSEAFSPATIEIDTELIPIASF